MRLTGLILLTSLMPALIQQVAGEDAKTEFHGAGWSQSGRISESYDEENALTNYKDNWLGSSGAVIVGSTTIDENWSASLGLGSVMVHLPRGTAKQSNIWYPFWVSFVDEAQVTYSTRGFAENGGFQLKIGAFPYNYNPDVKNLGLYLMNGYVYPGAIVSGFKSVLSGLAKNVNGGMARYQHGGFRNDFIINSEVEDRPFFDFSIADVVNYRVHSSVEIGAGVNFYRAIPANEKATSPTKSCVESDLSVYAKQGHAAPFSPCFIVRTDTAGVPVDTITGSLGGTKLMGRFRVDPKVWFGSPASLGANDLVFYGEAAVIGLKDYPVFYDNILQRIPVMLGFNLPGFGYLNWSIEGEYYASKNSSDNLGPQNGSWLPSLFNEVDAARDDWKWSLNASRMLTDHLVLAGMVANDHLRLGGTHNLSSGVEVLRRPKDWYWTTQLAYFF